MKWFFKATGLLILFHFGAESASAQPRYAEWPALRHGDKVVCHLAYCLVYSEKHEQAFWVAYELTAEETQKAHERSNQFLEDPEISTGSASDKDYAGSGFDRGHLAPAADMGWSQQAMEESFYFSNMSPQRPQCNRGIWKKGEELVRNWARQYGKLLVVTGPVLKEGLPVIGPNKVSVPEYFFKVLLRPDSLHPQVMAFLVPNQGSPEPISAFAVPADSIEAITQLDFFPWLDDQTEAKLEASVCVECWEQPGNFSPRPRQARELEELHQIQENHHLQENPSSGDEYRCHGITKNGTRCKRKVQQAGGNCYQHGG